MSGLAKIAAASGLLIGMAAPAAATVSVVAANCAAIGGTHGCLFTDVLTSAKVAATESAFNLFNNTHPSAGADIHLSYLFASNGVGFPGTVTGTTGGTWSTPGFIIKFLAVNAGPNFVLYKLPAVASSGSWSTIDIPHTAALREKRNLIFFGSAVPEAETWAMMIAGFGFVGLMARRRRIRPVSA